MGNLTTSWYNGDILGFEWFDWISLSLYGERIWPFRSRLQHQPAAASSEFTTASIAVGDLRYPQITMANSYCRWLLVSPWLVSHTSFVLSYRHFSWVSSCNSNAIHPQTLDPLSVPHPLALVYTQRAHFIRVKSAQTPGRKFPVFEICCISVSISNVFSQVKISKTYPLIVKFHSKYYVNNPPHRRQKSTILLQERWHHLIPPFQRVAPSALSWFRTPINYRYKPP